MINSKPTSESEDIRNHILQLEGEWEFALRMNDAERLNNVMADDWTMISAEGRVITKAQALSALRSGALRYESVTFRDVDVRAYAGAAVVRGRSREQGGLREEMFNEQYIFTDVFILRDGAWKSVLTHVTRLP